MRGKHISAPCPACGTRITPAHAGKTRSFRYHPAGTPDHPRACGENVHRVDSLCRRVGSPPRMRGKRISKDAQRRERRITPAHAGKTLSIDIVSITCTDHPRACGENDIYLRGSMRFRGSPPRMRGKLSPQGISAYTARITPAHAGKTSPKRRT